MKGNELSTEEKIAIIKREIDLEEKLRLEKSIGKNLEWSDIDSIDKLVQNPFKTSNLINSIRNSSYIFNYLSIPLHLVAKIPVDYSVIKQYKNSYWLDLDKKDLLFINNNADISTVSCDIKNLLNCLERSRKIKVGADGKFYPCTIELTLTECSELIPGHIIDFSYYREFIINRLLLQFNKLEKLKDKELIFLIGDSGSGKSTLCNFMLNPTNSLKLKQFKHRTVVELETNLDSDALPKISHQVASQTMFVDPYPTKDDKFVVDCGGFQGTQGNEQQLLDLLSVRIAMHLAKSIKVLFVVPAGDIINHRPLLHINTQSHVFNLMSLFKVDMEKIQLLLALTHSEQKGFSIDDVISILKKCSKSEDSDPLRIAIFKLLARSDITTIDYHFRAQEETYKQLLSKIEKLPTLQKTELFQQDDYKFSDLERLLNISFSNFMSLPSNDKYCSHNSEVIQMFIACQRKTMLGIEQGNSVLQPEQDNLEPELVKTSQAPQNLSEKIAIFEAPEDNNRKATQLSLSEKEDKVRNVNEGYFPGLKTIGFFGATTAIVAVAAYMFNQSNTFK